MKCRLCAAPSRVLATRKYKDVLLRRERQCFNGHNFHTYEVYAGNIDRRTIEATLRGIKARAQQQKMKRLVLKNPTRTVTSLAIECGVSEARVRQIRSEQREPETA